MSFACRLSFARILTDLTQPSNVRFAEHQSAESLAIEWTKPGCGETGYIEHFVVAACRLDDDSCDCRQGDGDFSYFVDVSRLNTHECFFTNRRGNAAIVTAAVVLL